MDEKTKTDELREHVRGNRNKGIKCPTCDQFVKVYRRKVNSSMAYGLIEVYHYFRSPGHEEWLHVPDYKDLAKLGGDFAKLGIWGLVEPMPGERDDGCKHTGYYRITDRGVAFVEGRLRIPKYAFTFNQTVLSMTEDQDADIHDALADEFSYRELMSR